MKNIKTCAVGLALSGLLLSGCHQNSLLKGKPYSEVQGSFIDRSFTDHDSRDCGAYYRDGASDPKLKSTCEQWLTRFYNDRVLGGEFTSDATVEDLRDPKLWALLTPKK